MKIWTHSQNLNKGWAEGEPSGPMWRHGRAWLHLDSKVIRLEWSVFKRDTFALGVAVGTGDNNSAMLFKLALPWIVSLWLSLEGFLPRKWFREWEYWAPFGRDTDVRIFDGGIWFSFWHNDDMAQYLRWPKIVGLHIHRSKRGPGFMVSFHPADFVFGYNKYSEATISTTDGEVELPEASYPVTVRMMESRWKRPRWPGIKRLLRAEVEAKDQSVGIPAHAGKGENAWDLDDDAMFSATLPASTPEQAIEKLTASILRDRNQYGPPAVASKDRMAE